MDDPSRFFKTNGICSRTRTERCARQGACLRLPAFGALYSKRPGEAERKGDVFAVAAAATATGTQGAITELG